ncbi:MAG: bifunctional phosphoribosylaminoimidazolecarboxamide formyltransferase/IMP cyclohydrolase [Clostridium sp.]|jgi:phosphoribosylaminoimidazolecarboxamide formyltransferase/IMP cyclohydrolase|nr:bifunctional phosphoribosylaminoimidazolecarboxamide formyltransferase/IMP cyclohydrolase [Clostridium sp.]
MKRRAILSVFDKTGVVDFASQLLELGFELLSTGGTHRALTEAGLPCTEVSDITGFPECLDGRVKTLHPAIHGGLLAMRSNPAHMARIAELGIEPIDVVAVNLYPFAATIKKPGVTLEECIENIDIGGPTMLRAAAKNWQDVAVVVDPADYARVVEELKAWGDVTRETKFELCGKVFAHTAHYDALINRYLSGQRFDTTLPESLALPYERVQSMRYGENPHQAAAFYREALALPNTLPEAKQLHGKELSYNNINDANGALDCLKEFGTEQPAAVAVKHANPCGVGVGKSILEAYLNAYNADPVSIFGGIVALNRPVDRATAEELGKIFLEIILAPAFDADALEILTKKPNIRLLELPALAEPNPKGAWDMKRVAGGLLVQELDVEGLSEDELKCVTEREPSAQEKDALLFAWKVVKHTKSNGIVLAKGDATTGVGPGQTNRITALELAISYAGEKAAGSVMASDAFFPFSDCVEAAHKAGITAIIQPGGSIRDKDSIDKCNEYGIAMLFTGIRHFKH